MMRTLTIYRTTYRIFSTPDGLSDRTDGDTETDVESFERLTGSFDHDGRTVRWAETPARQAAESIYRAGLSPDPETLGRFGTDEPYSHPHDNTCEETSADLTGDDWTDTERRAVARMIEWTRARDLARAREYMARR